DRDDEPRLQHPPAAPARADGSCVRLSALTVEFVWHRPQNSAVAGQESKRPPIGGSLWHERRTCLLSQHKSPKAGYCSRFPEVIAGGMDSPFVFSVFIA